MFHTREYGECRTGGHASILCTMLSAPRIEEHALCMELLLTGSTPIENSHIFCSVTKLKSPYDGVNNTEVNPYSTVENNFQH
jgi:hypothetical protein